MSEQQETGKIPFTLEGADLAVVSEDVLRSRQRPRGRGSKPRDKSQLVIDKLVEQAYTAWVKAGRPAEFSKSKGGLVTVPPAQLLNVERAIRKAGTYLNLSVRFGQYYDADGNPELDETGRVQVVFRASERKQKETQ